MRPTVVAEKFALIIINIALAPNLIPFYPKWLDSYIDILKHQVSTDILVDTGEVAYVEVGIAS